MKKAPTKKTSKKTKAKTMKKIVKNEPKGKDAKKKWNFPLIKQEFMCSQYLEVTAFFKHEYSIDLVKNGHVNLKVKGWTEEKKRFIESVYQATLDKVVEKESTDNAKALKNLMEGLRSMVDKLDDIKKLNVKDLERLWGIFMTMNNKPTRYIKSDNTTLELPPDGLTDEEKKSLTKKLAQNGLI